jgi:hypothetical protein
LEGIRHTLDIEDHGSTCKDPLGWWVFRLKLGCKDIRIASEFCLVDWALIDTLVFLSVLDDLWTNKNNWDNAELFLGFALFETGVGIPSCTFNLETKYESTFTLL